MLAVQLGQRTPDAREYSVWYNGLAPTGKQYFWMIMWSPATCAWLEPQQVQWEEPKIRIGWRPIMWIKGDDCAPSAVRWRSEAPSPMWRVRGWHPHDKRPRSAPSRAIAYSSQPLPAPDPHDEDRARSDEDLILNPSQVRIRQMEVQP